MAPFTLSATTTPPLSELLSKLQSPSWIDRTIWTLPTPQPYLADTQTTSGRCRLLSERDRGTHSTAISLCSSSLLSPQVM